MFLKIGEQIRNLFMGQHGFEKFIPKNLPLDIPNQWIKAGWRPKRA